MEIQRNLSQSVTHNDLYKFTLISNNLILKELRIIKYYPTPKI